MKKLKKNRFSVIRNQSDNTQQKIKESKNKGFEL